MFPAAMDPNRRPLSSRDFRWVQALARTFARRGVSPNGISIAGMVFATLGAGFLWLSAHPDLTVLQANLCLLAAALGVQLRLMCNLLDGLVAVEGGRKGKAGNLFNEAPDRYADVVLLAAAGYAIGLTWLGWMAASFAVGTAYARAFGASLGLGQDFCGPFAKQQRMFFLTMGVLGRIIYGPSLDCALWLIAAGTLFTVLRRIVRIYRRLP